MRTWAHLSSLSNKCELTMYQAFMCGAQQWWVGAKSLCDQTCGQRSTDDHANDKDDGRRVTAWVKWAKMKPFLTINLCRYNFHDYSNGLNCFYMYCAIKLWSYNKELYKMSFAWTNSPNKSKTEIDNYGGYGKMRHCYLRQIIWN